MSSTIFALDAESGMGLFGEKLRLLRHQRWMTLRELADALGFRSHGFVGDLESGRKYPSLDLAVRIADFFGERGGVFDVDEFKAVRSLKRLEP